MNVRLMPRHPLTVFPPYAGTWPSYVFEGVSRVTSDGEWVELHWPERDGYLRVSSFRLRDIAEIALEEELNFDVRDPHTGIGMRFLKRFDDIHALNVRIVGA